MFFCFAYSNASSRGAKRRKIRSLPHPPVRQNPHLILPGESCIITLFSHWPVCRNGRRGGLKIPCANNTCGFDPHHRHKKEAPQLVWGAFFLSAACERVEQHDPAQQGSNQPCGLLLSARETPTTGIASSSKSKDFGLFFFFCSVSYTLVFSGKILTIAFAEDTLLEKSRWV